MQIQSTLDNLTRSHLRRVLTLKAGIDAMEGELCKLLGVPASLVALRDRARLKLIPASLRKQIEAAEAERMSFPTGIVLDSPVLKAHIRMKEKVRRKVGEMARSGLKRIRGRGKSAHRA